jgi:FkbM family methyltransferase
MTFRSRVSAAARARWATFQFGRVRRRLAGPRLLRAFADVYPEAFFIEIGANDGERDDPLRPLIRSRNWHGIMVEPVPYVFERLKANYADMASRIAFENLAIADRDGVQPFFHLRKASSEEIAELPGWYDCIGSFSRDTVLGHRSLIPDLEERLVRTDVDCATFESLCRRHTVSTFDLLLLDTEGYDAEILSLVDFAAHSPRLVVFEHYHLTAELRRDCRGLLEENGYELMEEGFDTWCLGPRCDPRLRQVWSSLTPAVPAISAETDHR